MLGRAVTLFLPTPVDAEDKDLLEKHFGGGETLQSVLFEQNEGVDAVKRTSTSITREPNKNVKILYCSLLPNSTPDQHPQHPQRAILSRNGPTSYRSNVEGPQLKARVMQSHDFLVKVRRTGIVVRRSKRIRECEEEVIDCKFHEDDTPHVEFVADTTREAVFQEPCDFIFQTQGCEKSNQRCRKASDMTTGFFIHPTRTSSSVPYYFTSREDLVALRRRTFGDSEQTEAPMGATESLQGFLSRNGHIANVAVNNTRAQPLRVPLPSVKHKNLRQACLFPGERSVIELLLADRKIWPTADLEAQLGQSPNCRRSDITKVMIKAYTYTLQNGCFNRLRIRFGYNPEEDPDAGWEQRHSVAMADSTISWLKKISNLGLTPTLRKVACELAERYKTGDSQADAGDSDESSLLHLFASLAENGATMITVQLRDCKGHAGICQILRAGIASRCDSSGMNGWYSIQSIKKVMAIIAEAHERWTKTVLVLAVYTRMEKTGVVHSSPIEAQIETAGVHSTGDIEDDDAEAAELHRLTQLHEDEDCELQDDDKETEEFDSELFLDDEIGDL